MTKKGRREEKKENKKIRKTSSSRSLLLTKKHFRKVKDPMKMDILSIRIRGNKKKKKNQRLEDAKN
jgi:hypothetical protein